jgi:hypothetical protein
LGKEEVVKVVDVVENMEDHVEIVGLRTIPTEVSSSNNGHEDFIILF